MSELSCAFAGHSQREFPFGFSEEDDGCKRLKMLMYVQVRALLDVGVTSFLSGMSRGVGMWGAEIVLEIKNAFPDIKLLCAPPYEGHFLRWPAQVRERCRAMLERADEVRYISAGYTGDCVYKRNRYLVDNTEFVLAVYNGQNRGETANMVRYAAKKGKTVVTIHPEASVILPFTMPERPKR